MSGQLAENIVHFARALRAAGLPVGPGAVLDAIAAVETGGIGTKQDFYWTLHAVLVTKHEHRPVFDQAFALFWRKRGLIEKLISMMSPTAPGSQEERKPEAAALRVAEALGVAQKEPEPPRESETIAANLAFSDREILQAKDFAQMSAAEIADAKRLIAGLVLPDDRVATRRLVADPKGQRLDMRRMMRQALRTGGHPVTLMRKGPAERHPPIVAVVDISGSMADYSRIFLHFLHALTDRRRNVHTFVFATRLTNITRDLKARDPDEALARAGSHVRDWEGGTRIAPALHAFNRHWLRRVTGQNPIVLLFTDGLERDGDTALAFETERLRRSCRRLVWLNPLLRFDGFAPKAAGIRAMLPHVDEFRPIHNLARMADLCAALQPGRAGERAGDPVRFGQRAA